MTQETVCKEGKYGLLLKFKLENYVRYLEDFGPIAMLMYLRAQGTIKPVSKNSHAVDMSALKFAPGISSDYVRFLQRLLIFYSYNTK